MDAAANNGVVLASDEVLRELKKKEDGAHDWMKARAKMIVPFDDKVEHQLKTIMNSFPRLVDTKKGRSGGDPFVIAIAIVRKLTVITSEGATGKLDVPKIPDVCKHLGVPCIRMVDFFREQQWTV